MDEIKKLKVNSTEFYIEIIREHECYFKKLLLNRKPENKYKKHVRLKTTLSKTL